MLEQGIRQGCPLSALLFLLVAEKIANIIRDDKKVKGFYFDNEHIKLCQLADDMTLFLADSNSLRHVLNNFEEFYRYAGLKLNRSKTEAIIVYNDGTLLQDDSLGIKWNQCNFKTLGIWFSIKCEQEMIKLNLEDKMEKMQTLLNIWSSRQLSLKGKITVLKSLVMPHIIHIASVLFLNEDSINNIEKMFHKFLWNNKKPMIAKNVIVQPICKGGLKMINMDAMIKSIRIMWIKRLNNPCEAKWKVVSWKLLGIKKELLFTKLGFKNLKANSRLHFYSQILKTWFDLVSVSPNTKNEILEECLYNNMFLLIDKKPINNEYNDWRRAGIIHVKDLINQTNFNVKSKERLEIDYNIHIPVMKYNMLVSAIPKSWFSLIHLNSNHENAGVCEKIWSNCLNNLETVSNKKIYNSLIEMKCITPASQNKWIEYYPFLESASWSDIYSQPFKIVRDTFTQTVQYKILHRIYNCNYNLFLWKIKEEPKCDYCSDIDTIEHYFFNCASTLLLWKSIENWLTSTFKLKWKFSILEVLLGIHLRHTEYFMLNYIIIIGKVFIKKYKSNNEQISFLKFLQFLKQKLSIEEQVYNNLNKIEIFMRNYGNLFDEL